MAGELDADFYLVQVSTDSGSTYTTVESSLAHDVTINNEPVVINNKSSKFQLLLEGAGVRSVSGSISGQVNTGTGYEKLLDHAEDNTHAYLKIIEKTGGDYITGLFHISSVQKSAPQKTAVGYAFSFTSHGTPTFTKV